ncbi:D-alanyl-D-alanine carboxypeptidase, partial [Kaistella carnis]
MKKLIPFILLFSQLYFAQNVAQSLETATKKLLSSSPAYSANVSIYVADENGNFVYENNGNKGLSTASTQKIFTAAAALETLGKDFQYVTTVNFSGTLSGGNLNGDLFITSTG